MFNLLVFSVDWPSGRVRVPQERIFEHTDPHISQQFKKDDELQFDLLKRLPCLFCVEGSTTEIAYVGRIDRVQVSGVWALLEISIDRKVPRLQNSMLNMNCVELGIHDVWEFSRNHWAVKDEDLYLFLLHNVRPRRQCPTAFYIPEYEDIDSTQVSAMMPFSAEFDAVYNSIQQASSEIDLNCARVDDIWENNAVMQDVAALIDRSQIVVCDCSGRNPNVFYEIGIAHTLGREVILITQNEGDIPFDLRHLRYIPYLNNTEGLLELKRNLQGRMQTLISR